VIKGIVGKVISAYSFDDYVKPVGGASVLTSVFDDAIPTDEDGEFSYPFMNREGQYQAKVSADNYWGTLVVGTTSHHQHIKVFPDSMVTALLDLTLGYRSPDEENLAVIWGRVEQEGKTLEGAKVELAGSDLRPIYFNALMIPDRSLRSTSSNGLFAYVGVQPGVHQIRAHHQRTWLPAQVIPAEARHVSHVVFEKVSTHSVPVRVFDAFQTDQPLSAVLRIIGDDNLVEINPSGYGVLDVPLDKHLMFIEATSFGDYRAVRMIRSRSTKYIHLPMITSQWIESLGIEIDNSKGVVVGFVTGHQLDEYDVFWGTDTSSSGHSMHFFSPAGEIVEKPVVGGGFVIVNVEPGLKTLIISPQEPYDLASRVIYVEPGIVSVVQQNF
jgi:hypothetical protein